MWIATSDPFLNALIQAGPAGIVVVGFVTGWLWAKPAVQQLQRDLDRALTDLREVRKEQRELEASQRDIVIPAIVKFIEIGEAIQRRLDSNGK